MARILILHPGEMGAAVGKALVDVGHDVRWIPEGRSAPTRSRAEGAGLRPVADPADCDLVMSVCPPAGAVAVAAAVAATLAASDRRTGTGPAHPAAGDPARAVLGSGRPSQIFLDANAIAPTTAERIAADLEAVGMSYVDGGIVGPPPTRDGTTRLYLSGADAPAVAELFRGARIEPRVIDGAGATAASGLKMAYAAWSKISAALLLGVDAAAARLGIGKALRTEWALSQPDLPERLQAALAAATAKGWRWEAEMREIAATFDSAGQPDGYGLAAAETFSRFARPGSAGHQPPGSRDEQLARSAGQQPPGSRDEQLARSAGQQAPESSDEPLPGSGDGWPS